jgi:hypothetical protein
MIEETTWAYFAGMLDGEGSFSIFRHYKKDPHVSKRGYEIETRVAVSNMNQNNILQLQKMVEKGHITLVNNKREYGIAVVADLRFSPNEQRYILPKVLPYLIQKKELATIILEFLEYRSTPNKIKEDREQKYYQFEKRFEEAVLRAKPWLANLISKKGKPKRILTAPN